MSCDMVQAGEPVSQRPELGRRAIHCAKASLHQPSPYPECSIAVNYQQAMSASTKEHDGATGATGATGETTATTATKTLWTGFLSFIWDSDSHLKSPEERRLLFKLDCAMLSCLCLGGYQLEHRRVMSRREGEPSSAG